MQSNQPIQTDQLNQALGGQGTPSPLSPTPSPAGSVGSVGSQSSGYSSGELAVRSGGSGSGGGGSVPVAGSTTAGQPPALCMLVPMNVYNSMTKQNHHFTYLFSCQELWEQADILVFKSDHKSK